MKLTIDVSELNFETKKVVDYWRDNFTLCLNMSDSEILKSVLFYAICEEFKRIEGFRLYREFKYEKNNA